MSLSFLLVAKSSKLLIDRSIDCFSGSYATITIDSILKGTISTIVAQENQERHGHKQTVTELIGLT
jgi:hypothetical protein